MRPATTARRRNRRLRDHPVSRLGVVVNPTAGRGRGTDLGSHTTRLLRSRGHDVVDLSAGTIAEATRNARREILAGVDALVVVGGDGMVHLGVNVVAGTALPLGIVAGGTGNDIARSLGLPRHDVRASLQAIEHAHGRERPYVNAPRTLDLDLLLYGEVVVDTPRLRVPHPRLHRRAFVLRPLLELAPALSAPGLGALAPYLDTVADQPIERIA